MASIQNPKRALPFWSPSFHAFCSRWTRPRLEIWFTKNQCRFWFFSGPKGRKNGLKTEIKHETNPLQEIFAK